jgi:hypothetical protein
VGGAKGVLGRSDVGRDTKVAGKIRRSAAGVKFLVLNFVLSEHNTLCRSSIKKQETNNGLRKDKYCRARN